MEAGIDREPALAAAPGPLEGGASRGDSGGAAGTALAAAAAAALAACGGGADSATDSAAQAAAAQSDALGISRVPTVRDATRFLTQATFGVRSVDEVGALRELGFNRWLAAQFALEADSHLAYIEARRKERVARDNPMPRACEEDSYEAMWQQWLFGKDVLRARMSWALMQIMVISNIAPDIRPHAMSSYMDMMNRNAFGNYRQLLEDVTLHPAMGYYLNMLESQKADPAAGTHPNENYAREVLQLFSIGLVKLKPDGTPQLDANGKTIPTFDESVVRGFARAFSGWSYGALDNTDPDQFHHHDDNLEALWVVPMKAWAAFHSPESKTLLDGTLLPAGQTAEKDMADALDNIFRHPNVGPFISRQLIQRLVTSNPSPAYVSDVAGVFNDNGAGVRGDLKAVLRAILLHAQARGDDATTRAGYGKLREPVVRFANFLRGLNASSQNGRNAIHYLDSADDALGQSPLLAPSVFNFYSPSYRPAGALAAAGLVAPEFQITTETTVVGSLNFFASLFADGGYGYDASRLRLDTAPLVALAGGDGQALVDRLDALFFNSQMGTQSRDRLLRLIAATPAGDRDERVRRALLVTALSPDFVVQK